MSNRTYRYYDGKPLFAFGHGLSYTRFDYRDATLQSINVTADGTLKLTFTLRNTGARDGDEVAQVYLRRRQPEAPQPRLSLGGFVRVHLPQGQTARVAMQIPVARFRDWDAGKNQYTVAPGNYELLIGAASDDLRLRLPLKVSPPTPGVSL